MYVKIVLFTFKTCPMFMFQMKSRSEWLHYIHGIQGVAKILILLCFYFLLCSSQDAQEFLRCIMDQLHEELKQPVLSVEEHSESSDSDDDGPNHHNKRLLGGTSLPHSGNLQDGTTLSCFFCWSEKNNWLKEEKTTLNYFFSLFILIES